MRISCSDGLSGEALLRVPKNSLYVSKVILLRDDEQGSDTEEG